MRHKWMKKIVPMILLVSLLLQACSKGGEEPTNSSEPSQSSEQTTSSTTLEPTESTTEPIQTEPLETDPNTGDPISSTGLYHVRDSWDRADTQTGAFAVYGNAVEQAILSGQNVYGGDGKLLYDSKSDEPPNTNPNPDPDPSVSAPLQSETIPPGGYGDYSQLSNANNGWYYTAGSPVNQDVPATIDAAREQTLAKYGALWKMPDTGKKVIYLTMDEGYEYETNTTKILDVAKEKGVKITFFVTGHYVKSQPELVKRMVAEGHQVANHTDNHLVQPEALETSVATLQADINDVNTMFRDLTGQNLAPFMRPPTGAWSERSLAVSRELGYTPVFWSFAYRDWEVDNQPSLDEAYETIMGQLFPGSILLVHAVSKSNADVLGRLIDGIHARGYQIELLPEN